MEGLLLFDVLCIRWFKWMLSSFYKQRSGLGVVIRNLTKATERTVLLYILCVYCPVCTFRDYVLVLKQKLFCQNINLLVFQGHDLCLFWKLMSREAVTWFLFLQWSTMVLNPQHFSSPPLLPDLLPLSFFNFRKYLVCDCWTLAVNPVIFTTKFIQVLCWCILVKISAKAAGRWKHAW